MSLYLHNTATRRKDLFVPLDPQKVGMYVCGPTVYDRAHIGNARPVVVFDTLYRLLKRLYPSVTYVRNITDVDDRINARAKEAGEPISALTARTTEFYHADMGALNALPPDIEPRATAHIPQMLAMMAQLIEDGHAYEAEGHVLFSISSMKDYGALSGRSMDEMIAGARVEVAPYKRDPGDFVLWKPSTDDLPGWDSPYGRGRPGWHIECSAMAREYLGITFDIHGGGHDLIFPHHENEIAQGVCAQHGHDHDAEYARYWMHNGFLTLDAEKMSKSLGNVKLVHDLIKEVPGEVIRLALLSAHYRGPLDWTGELIAQTRSRLDGLYGTLRKVKDVAVQDVVVPQAVMEALCDDLNTPRALAELSSLAKAVEVAESDTARSMAKSNLLAAAGLLGLLQGDADAWFTAGADDDLTAKVEGLLAERIAARAAKNWPEADRIRKELDDLGIVVMDGPTGATWKLKTPEN